MNSPTKTLCIAIFLMMFYVLNVFALKTYIQTNTTSYLAASFTKQTLRDIVISKRINPRFFVSDKKAKISILSKDIMIKKCVRLGIDEDEASYILGLYHRDKPTNVPEIWCRSDLKDSLFVYCLEHELGHDVYFRILTDQEKVEYDKIYAAITEFQLFLTQYAATNVYEGFAEAFAWHTEHKIPKNSIEEAFIEKVDDRLLAETVQTGKSSKTGSGATKDIESIDWDIRAESPIVSESELWCHSTHR